METPDTHASRLSHTIASVSTFFAEKWRMSLLLLIAILLMGMASYTTFLKREGFPPVEVPIAIIQTPYFIDNTTQVTSQITDPISVAVSDVKGVKQISSQTTENFSVVIVEFEDGIKSDDGAKLVQDRLDSIKSDLPETAKPEIQTFKASQFIGKYDMIIAISADGKSIRELQDNAKLVAEELSSAKKVSFAEPINVITKEIDPKTGKEFDNQDEFYRVGFRNEAGEFVSREAIAIGIVKKNDKVGTIDLSDSVQDKIAELDSDILKGYHVSYVGDFSKSLKEQIGSLQENAITGIIMVLLIVFIFVSFRASIVTAIFIPLVMAATFVILFLGGYSINTITLFALVLILGLFVDDATVVVEAIDYQKKQGIKGLHAIRKAVWEVAIPDTTGTLSVILVFGPMLFVSGILGGFIVQIPITVLIAMSISLLFALTLIPFLSNKIIADKHTEEGVTRLEKIYVRIDNALQVPGNFINRVGEMWSKVINFYLRIPLLAILVVIPATIILIGFGGYMSSKLKFSIFPAPKDSEEVNLSINYPFGTSISEAENIAEEVEKKIIEKEGDLIDEISYYEANDSVVTAAIVLKSMDKRVEKSAQIAEDLQSIFVDYKRAEVKIAQSTVGPPESDYQFQMQVYEHDQSKLEKATTELTKFLENKTIQDDIKVSAVKVDGLNLNTEIDNRRYATVFAKISDKENTGAVLELRKQIENEFTKDKLSKLGLDEDALGFDLGEQSDFLESFNNMFIAFGFALVLLYILLVIQFNSFTQPLLVFIAIPLTFPGLFPGLYLTDNSLSFFVMIGVMALAGIVVNNTIMLMQFANHGLDDGMTVREAIVNAVKRRFRAIITTSITTLAGLLPLALTDPFWEGLALAMVFGLISSSVLVLTLFPAFFYVVENIRRFRNEFLTNIRYMQFGEAFRLTQKSLKMMVTRR